MQTQNGQDTLPKLILRKINIKKFIFYLDKWENFIYTVFSQTVILRIIMMSTYNPYSTSMQTLFIKKIIKTALEFLDDTDFKLSKEDKDYALQILQVNTNANGGSRAGKNKIIININGWQKQNVKNGKATGQGKKFKASKYKKNGYVYVVEYSSYTDDPKCGGMFVKIGDVDHANLITVLHELSHYVQRTLQHNDPDTWETPYMKKPHGNGFKEIYSLLREQFCNDDGVRQVYIDWWRQLAKQHPHGLAYPLGELMKINGDLMDFDDVA